MIIHLLAEAYGLSEAVSYSADLGPSAHVFRLAPGFPFVVWQEAESGNTLRWTWSRRQAMGLAGALVILAEEAALDELDEILAEDDEDVEEYE